MEFPISRERLRNIREEYYADQQKKYIDECAEYVVQNIIQTALSNKLTVQIWMKHIIGHSRRQLLPTTQRESLLPLILQKLQERFPDTSFIIDPMKTYMLVEWS
jgi:hypothetical protein